MENMGKQRLVDKSIGPADIVKALQTGNITTAQAQQMFNGIMPIGDYKGIAALYDIDKQVIQPLILAEKQWTLDKVDPRNGGCSLTVPIGTAVDDSVTEEIEVPAGEVWYLCEHEIRVPQVAALTAGDLILNFRVSSFPKENGADKAYYDGNDPQVYLCTGDAAVAGGGLLATQAEIAAGDITDRRLALAGISTLDAVLKYAVKRDFRDGDELNTELRLVGGDKLTLVATVQTAAVATAAIEVYLRVWGRVGKLLVS
ncbi:MAG TPA: hypothetical protein DIT43_01915 [Dehalococcoidia bacterium]|nr:hypothetical protein [Dehalococcoidia bacterium]